MNSPLLPYYHPSTVVFIDDNERFMEGFTLLLDEDLAFRCFSSAKLALEFINRPSNNPPLDQRCFSFLGQQHRPGGEIRLDLALIEQEISNLDRFADISVIIVDYDMPEMNGLEFCKSIRNRRIKKILLTGIGDEKIAISAFNDGLIDRFLTKNDPNIADKINQIIFSLQRRYFEDISSLIQSTLAMKSPEFIYDDAFKPVFDDLIKEYSIAEYYYVEDPYGFLMVACDGTLYRLIVCSEDQANEQIFSLKKFSPPSWVMSNLKKQKHLAWLWTSPDDVDEEDAFGWEDYLHPAQKIRGQKTWLYSMVDNPPADIEYNSEEASYKAYLDGLDLTK
jgi:CheY-like chemotaxis protein